MTIHEKFKMGSNEGTKDEAVIIHFRFSQRCWRPQGSSEHTVKFCCHQFQQRLCGSCSQPFSSHKAELCCKISLTQLQRSSSTSFLSALPAMCSVLAAVPLPCSDHNNGPSPSESKKEESLFNDGVVGQRDTRCLLSLLSIFLSCRLSSALRHRFQRSSQAALKASLRCV